MESKNSKSYSRELRKKIKYPQRYIEHESGYPPRYSGNFLCWLLCQMGTQDGEYDPKDIVYVETIQQEYYEFEVQAFDVPMTSYYDFIKSDKVSEIKQLRNIKRFGMKDGAIFEVMESDGEYNPDRLYYIPPPPKFGIKLKTGIQDILNKDLNHKNSSDESSD
jgi:hypothetical protein